MHFIRKVLICISLSLGATTVTYAVPVTEESTQQFFELLDEDNIIIQRKADPSAYHRYALTRVYQVLGGEQPLTNEQKLVVADIEKIYSNADTTRLEAIKNESIEKYKTIFQSHHDEQSIKQQLSFMSSPVGQSILDKQAIRQNAIQKLYQSLPAELAQQADLQDALRKVPNN